MLFTDEMRVNSAFESAATTMLSSSRANVTRRAFLPAMPHVSSGAAASAAASASTASLPSAVSA